jgi:hypothetical protein
MTKDDSYASERGAASKSSLNLNALQYKCTVTLSSKEPDGRDVQTETVLLDLSENGISPSSILLEPLPVLNVDVFTVRRVQNDIQGLNEDPRGRVCLCDMKTLKDIHAVQRIVAVKGAKALVLSTKPSEQANVPVFVISEAALWKLKILNFSTVTMQQLEVDQPSKPHGENTDAGGDTRNEAWQLGSSSDQFADARMDKLCPACLTGDGALYEDLGGKPLSLKESRADGGANRPIEMLDFPNTGSFDDGKTAAGTDTRMDTTEAVRIVRTIPSLYRFLIVFKAD